jgi:hypothetical protein
VLQRNLVVLAIVAALVVPIALAAPKSSPAPDDSDAYVNEAGDTMKGSLEMQRNAVTWYGEGLTSPTTGELTFAGVRVCLANGNCRDAYPTYAAGDGLVLGGTTFALLPCSKGQILKVVAGAWSCSVDDDVVDRVGTVVGNDDDFLYFDDGSAESFSWRDAASRFNLTDSLEIEGDLSVRGNQIDLTSDGRPTPAILFNGTWANPKMLAWQPGQGNLQFCCGSDFLVGGGFYAQNETRSGGNISVGEIVGPSKRIWFGTPSIVPHPLMRYLEWNGSQDRFFLNRDLYVNGTISSTNVDNDTLGALPCVEGDVPKFTAGSWSCGGGGSGSMAWDDLTGIPAGFADGVDDDALAGLPCADGDAVLRSGGAWACAPRGELTGDIDITGALTIGDGDRAGVDRVYFGDGSTDYLEWHRAANGRGIFTTTGFLVTEHGLKVGENLTVEGGEILVAGDDGALLVLHDREAASSGTIRYDSGLFTLGSSMRSVGSISAEYDVMGSTLHGSRLLSESHMTLGWEADDADQEIRFHEDGIDNGERLQWDDSADRFEFSDDLHVFGEISSSSTMRLKHNIAPLTNALTMVLALRGVSYDRIEDDRHEIGLLAEDVVRVIPEVVVLDDEGLPAGIDYSRLVAVLISAMQEQQARIDALEAQQEDMLSRLERIEEQMAG